MLVSEEKPLEEILRSLEGEDRLFLLGCRGCAEACQTGGEKEVLAMKERLEGVGKKIAGWAVLDFLEAAQIEDHWMRKIVLAERLSDPYMPVPAKTPAS